MRTYFLRPPTFAQWLMPKAMWKLEGRKSEINLSFDDGPNLNSTIDILTLLSSHDIKATFFLLGTQIEKHPSLYNEIKSEGHQIGSHGYQHIDGWRADNKDYTYNAIKGAEIAETELFRPPYGRVSISQYQRLHKQLRIVMWSLMTGDFDRHVTSAIHAKRLNNLCHGGDIIVFHDQDRASSLLIDGFEEFVGIVEGQNCSFSLL